MCRSDCVCACVCVCLRAQRCKRTHAMRGRPGRGGAGEVQAHARRMGLHLGARPGRCNCTHAMRARGRRAHAASACTLCAPTCNRAHANLGVWEKYCNCVCPVKCGCSSVCVCVCVRARACVCRAKCRYSGLCMCLCACARMTAWCGCVRVIRSRTIETTRERACEWT